MKHQGAFLRHSVDAMYIYKNDSLAYQAAAGDSQSGFMHRACPSVRLSVCRQKQKRDFLKK